MSFPTDPLDVVVEIAPGADPSADPRGYVWTDVSSYWRHAGPISIARGKSSPLAETMPATCSLQLDNTDGRFTPRNPLGPYYPDLQRNTPLRIRLRQFYDTFTRTGSDWGTPDVGPAWTTSGGSASNYSTDGTAGVHTVDSVNVTRESTADVNLAVVDVTVTGVAVSAAPTGAAIHQAVAARYDASNYVELRVFRGTAGAPTVVIRQLIAGVETFNGFPAVAGATGGSVLSMRLQAVGSVLRGKVWIDGQPEPTDWLVELTGTLLDAGDVAIRTLAETGNTNGTFTATYGSIDISSTRFTGYVDRWPSRWDPSGTLQWVPITAHGTLKRIATAGLATQSALYRYITAQDWQLLAGYWPGEDGPLAGEAANRAVRRNQFRSVMTGGLAPSAPVKFGAASPAGGVGTMIDASGAYLHVRLAEQWAEDWRVECVVAHGQAPAGTVRVLSWLTPGTIQRWDLNTGTSGYQLVGWTAVSGGTAVVTVNSGVAAQPGVLQHLRVDVTRSGTTNTAAVYVDGTAAGSGTYSPSTTLRPTVMRVNPDASQDVPLVGHVAIWAGTPLPATDSADVALGKPGEQAHERIEAVCLERGVPYAATTTATVTSQTMGPRPDGSLVALLREAEATDGGILYELTSGHLAYRPRLTLYNQDAALSLDYEQRHIVEMEPADDDAQLRNDVTAKRPSGSEARYVDDANIAAVGRYETSLSANPDSDAALEQLAAWAVHRGTPSEQRFDVISLRMRAGPEVVDGWLGCDIGSRITVANVPAQLTPDPVDVLMVGYVETIQFPATWNVDMVCEPASVWTVGELDDPVLGRLDTAGSELASGNVSAQIRGDAANRAIVSTADAALFAAGNRVVLHDPDGRRKEPTVFTITAKTGPAFGVYDLFLDPLPAETILGNFTGDYDSVRRVDETSLSVATTSGAVWWPALPGGTSFDINVNGERMTVTAISGASSPQTLTVVRAVNGVEKHHAAGTAVRLWQPLTLGL